MDPNTFNKLTRRIYMRLISNDAFSCVKFKLPKISFCLDLNSATARIRSSMSFPPCTATTWQPWYRGCIDVKYNEKD